MAIKCFKQRIWSLGLILCGLVAPSAFGKNNELVILTTFSSEPIEGLISEFKIKHPDTEVKVIHRRTQSAIQMLNKRFIQDIDMVLSSSPFLMQQLERRAQLAQTPVKTITPEWLSEFVLPPKDKVVSIGYSGAGVIWNQDYLKTYHLPLPTSFIDLTAPTYFGHITMSTPSRSGTTQMMIESILTRYGWEQGWRIVLNIGANLGTISSRSFGVSDYVAKGQFAIGPTIDSYAMILSRRFNHLGFAYDKDFTLMPTYVAQISKNDSDEAVRQFIEFLISDSVQQNLQTISFSKHALNNPELFNQQIPSLDLAIVMERETLVNQIFDNAITQRLPGLQDSWASIIKLQKQFQDFPKQQQRLEQVAKILFTLPVSEKEIQQLSQQLNALEQESNQLSGQKEAMIAEFNYRLNSKLDKNLERVQQSLRAIQQELMP